MMKKDDDEAMDIRDKNIYVQPKEGDPPSLNNENENV